MKLKPIKCIWTQSWMLNDCDVTNWRQFCQWLLYNCWFSFLCNCILSSNSEKVMICIVVKVGLMSHTNYSYYIWIFLAYKTRSYNNDLLNSFGTWFEAVITIYLKSPKKIPESITIPASSTRKINRKAKSNLNFEFISVRRKQSHFV